MKKSPCLQQKNAKHPCSTAQAVLADLYTHADPVRAQNLLRFFKTGKGQYGEGDIFWGLYVPVVRKVCKQHTPLAYPEIAALLAHEVHEVRLCALLIMQAMFHKAPEAQRAELIALYLQHALRVNNWDLVDLSVGMLGTWLLDKDRAVLYRLAQSPHLWEQRMAMVATLTFIRQGDFADTLALAATFLEHKHDLMHKAVGWMLREVGKKDRAVLTEFLQQHLRAMPRTALRYAIEHYSPEERKAWLRA